MASEEIPVIHQSLPWKNITTSHETVVVNEHSTPREIQELITWQEVTVLTLISPQTSLQMEQMEVSSALINSHVKE